jgi:transposase
VVIPFLNNLEEAHEDRFSTIFMEDGAKIHLGHAKRVREDANIKTFAFWPPSSPDLNPIEKVWRWMKGRISRMEPFPTKIDDLKRIVQELWDEMDPTMFIHEIEQMPEKCAEVLRRRGGPTKY